MFFYSAESIIPLFTELSQSTSQSPALMWACLFCFDFQISPRPPPSFSNRRDHLPSGRRDRSSSTTRLGLMWLASPFSYLCSATPAPYSAVSVVRQLSSSLLPRALAVASSTSCSSSRSSRRLVVASSSVRATRSNLYSAAGGRRGLLSASCTSGDGGAAMVPDDASSLLRAVYDAKPRPQVCLTTTG